MKELQHIYEEHHQKNRPKDFSILEKDRADLIVRYIGKGKKVLDIGCRDGILTRHFVDGNQVTGIDVDVRSLEKAKEYGIQTMSFDLNGSWEPLASQSFDVIVAGEVVEHLYFPQKVCQKVSAHLHTGGMFIGSVPNAFSLKHRFRYMLGRKKYTPLSDPTHINHFSYDELVQLLKKDFSKVEVLGLGRYHRLAKWFPSLFAFDLFFIAHK